MEIYKLKDLVDTLRMRCDNVNKRIWICSPYIGGLKSIRKIIGIKWMNKNIDFRILTDLSNPYNFNIDTILTFLKYSKIKSLKALHAKIYITDDLCLLTSANLTSTAFSKRYEIGTFLNKTESKDVIKFFNEYWETGEKVFKIKKSIINTKRNKKGAGEESFTNFKKLNDLPDDIYKEYAGWLKISGFSDKRRKQMVKIDHDFINGSFVGTPQKPGLKEDDIVILSRMGFHNKKNDNFIYGRAKVGIPYREGVDDLKPLISFIDKSEIDAIDSVNRWPYGFWVKDLELIKGNSKKCIWISELKFSDNSPVIQKVSLSQHSHIKLDNKQLNKINKKLNKYFIKYGKHRKKNPTGIWINKFINNPKHKVKKIR